MTDKPLRSARKALGVKITLVDARDTLLTFLDREMVDQLAGSMRRMGIDLRLGMRWASVKREGERVVAKFTDGAEIAAEQLLYAAGREGRTQECS